MRPSYNPAAMRHDQKTEPQHRRPRLVQGDVTSTSPTPTAPPRNRRRVRLAAALASLVAIAAFGASPAQAAKAPKDFFGVVPQTTPTTSRVFERLGQGKVGAMRIGIFWSAVDPAAPAGGYDFSSIDPLVANAANNGVEILPYLYGTPAWVVDRPRRLWLRQRVRDVRAEVRRRAQRLGRVRRRGRRPLRRGRHVLGPEPEHPEGAGRGVPDLERAELVGLLRAEGRTRRRTRRSSRPRRARSRRADPTADIVLGGMPQLGGSSKAIPGTKYLKKLYKVEGHQEAVRRRRRAPVRQAGRGGHRPGRGVPRGVGQGEGQVGDALGHRDRAGARRRAATRSTSAAKGQAKRLKESFKFFKKNRKKLKIQQVDWYSYQDSPPSVCDWCATRACSRPSGAPKPAWNAFTKFTGGS